MRHRLPGPAAALLILLAPAVAGCLAEPLAPAGLPGLARLEPWRENWTMTGTAFAFDLDPEAPLLTAEGTVRIRNDLGRPQGYVTFLLEPFEVASVRDEGGRDLPFTTESAPTGAGTVPAPPLPPEALRTAAVLQRLNVTLDGAIGPGAERTLALAYEGWGGRDRVVLGGGAPNDLGMPRLLLHPIAGGSLVPVPPSTFTLRHPADWVVLATAEPVASVEEEGAVATTYTSRVPTAAAVMAQGIEWLEEDVHGVQVRTYFFPDMRVQGQTTHDVTRHVLTQMPNLTGPYPFRHLWTVPNQVDRNAFSTPGLTFMGLNFYRGTLPGVPLQFSRFAFPGPVPGGQDNGEQVVVHEHTHNWWGHNVRGNNTNATLGPLETWVTEGVTTYLSELVWMQTQYGDEDAAHTARDRALDCLDARRANGGERAITEPGGLAYSKTAMALRALEAYAIQRGTPDAVLDALRLAQQRFGRLQGGSGIATTEQMFGVFADAFGEDVRWHLEPWFYGRELSDFRVVSAQRGEGNVTVAVANAGQVPGAVQLKATTLAGRALWAWGFVPGAGEAEVTIPLPAGSVDPVVRVEADPYQYVYEWDDADNVWVGVA